ncbi:hypothetical protein [Streptacidiphilus cavernicola]|uniref:Uncharacterized protein n=1 Tax=Streptacidiphilus cavernicola TaxID=3342716 RepID=A0ABV6VY22_9ACTN
MTQDDPKPDDAWRAIDAPFRPRDDWQPIPGACSRCGERAWLGETRWWHHTGRACPSRRPAEFIPDPAE